MSNTVRADRSRGRPAARVVVAAGLAGLALLPGSGAATAEPAFGGFATEATATPLRIALYEPVVPIPSEPQAEVDLAYTTVQSATGPSATGRASWFWPGDAVGEGCKTFVEQLRLQDTGLCEDGYPVQVNSQTPGGPEHARDEQFPGTVMRTSASADRTVAKAGWSPDGRLEERTAPKPGGDAPEPPLPVPGDLSQLGAAITGKQQAEPEPPPNALFPDELAAVVDVGAMSSVSEVLTAGDRITAVATSRVTDLALLDGLITADTVRVTTTATSNGRTAGSDIDSRVAGLAIAGNAFVVDRKGVRAAGETVPIDGLPDDPAEALARLGVAFEVPQGQRRTQDMAASAAVDGLRITLDLAVLRRQLDTGALEDAVGQVTKEFPEDAAQLRSAVGALFQVSPKVVLTLGNAAASTTTVPGIDLPVVDVPETPIDTGAAGPAGGGLGGASAGGDALAPPAGSGPAAAPAAGDATVTTGVATENVAAGLPPLASIPGALLVGGIVAASGVGWWLQRIGGLVIGGAGACAHGLETGVPDLRKA